MRERVCGLECNKALKFQSNFKSSSSKTTTNSNNINKNKEAIPNTTLQINDKEPIFPSDGYFLTAL